VKALLLRIQYRRRYRIRIVSLKLRAQFTKEKYHQKFTNVDTRLCSLASRRAGTPNKIVTSRCSHMTKVLAPSNTNQLSPSVAGNRFLSLPYIIIYPSSRASQLESCPVDCPFTSLSLLLTPTLRFSSVFSPPTNHHEYLSRTKPRAERTKLSSRSGKVRCK
jgi:hypothetical protein